MTGPEPFLAAAALLVLLGVLASKVAEVVRRTSVATVVGERSGMRIVVVVSVLVALGSVSCTSGGSEPGLLPTEEAADLAEVPLLGPGTELADRFEVPDGAELMTWPTGGWYTTGVDAAWGASMWVTGDPIEVFNSLAAQAAEQGYDVVQQGDGNCRILQDTPPEPWIDCHALGYRVDPGPRSDRVHLSVSDRGNGLPLARLDVGTVETDVLGDFGVDPWQLRPFEPETAQADASDVDLVPSDVVVGDRLVDADWHRTTLVRDSRLVAAKAGPGDDCTAGMAAVLHVDGDPDDVFDLYARQLDAAADQGGVRTEEEPRADVLGRRVRVVRGGWEGHTTMTMVVGREGEPTRILIEEQCPD